VTAPNAGLDPDAEADSDFHLVESRDGWTLELTRHALDALLELRQGAAAPPAASCTVHVQPNLLPSHPFPATVVIANSRSREKHPGPATPS